MTLPNDYSEMFDLEVEAWCFALRTYVGEPTPGLVDRLIGAFEGSLHKAVEAGYVFDIGQIAVQLSESTKFRVSRDDILMALAAYLPHPTLLNNESQMCLAQIVDSLEQLSPGMHNKLEVYWSNNRPVKLEKAA